jgi:hypothetical protein
MHIGIDTTHKALKVGEITFFVTSEREDSYIIGGANIK